MRAHLDAPGPSIADVAGALVVRHHSAVELVSRAKRAGLVGRRDDPGDGRVVRLYLTAEGALALAALAAVHAEELARLEGAAD